MICQNSKAVMVVADDSVEGDGEGKRRELKMSRIIVLILKSINNYITFITLLLAF